MPGDITILNDGQFDIAIGRSRHELSWKNKVWTWTDLVTKLSKTIRTHETYKEYVTAKAERQMELKDVGGFVGGFISGGKKLASNILHRQVLTLDIDHISASLFGLMWDEYASMYGNAACMYSTHKHSATTPRYRLVLPLSREVWPDEYEAIGRRIAGHMGIENFDNTGFQPSRLMYWPSTSKDGIFEFHYQDGPWLDADAVLATYHDWRDTSEWPIGEGYKTKIRNDIKRQGDPLEKPGTIGAFCRTYSIHEAIDKFLEDVYSACDIPERYTYVEGSTSAGLITYDDKFAYSHHGTDPISMNLCNAFDLVRIHKFGLRDEDCNEDTPVNKKPSYLAMVEFAVKDVEVRKRIGAERVADARMDFAEDGWVVAEGVAGEIAEESGVALPEDMDWIATLEVDRKGNYYVTLDNIIIILENDPRLKGKIRYNTFEMRETVVGDLPWRKVTGDSGFLTDRDVSSLLHYIERAYKIGAAPKIEHALRVVFEKHQFHPVRDYLNGLKWDGVNRVAGVLIDYLGCEDSAYTRAITRKWFAAAVNRIFVPGCKFDYMLVLIGKQGLKKSMLFDKLGMGWFSDSFTTVKGKEAWEQLQGAWIIEVAELSGMHKAEVETIKHFITKRKDRYRVAYGRRVEEFPRQCALLGTTNNKTPLKDTTGGRRFWGSEVHKQAPTKEIGSISKKDIDQIWAEAKRLYDNGEELYLDAELEAVANSMQQEYTEQDERAGMVQKYLDTLLPEAWEDLQVWDRRNWLKDSADETRPRGSVVRKQVCAPEIFAECFGGTPKDFTPVIGRDIHAIMRNMQHWNDVGQASFKFYGRLKGYVRTNVAEIEREKFKEFDDGYDTSS